MSCRFVKVLEAHRSSAPRSPRRQNLNKLQGDADTCLRSAGWCQTARPTASALATVAVSAAHPCSSRSWARPGAARPASGSEPGDDRVRDSNTEILIAADHVPTTERENRQLDRAAGAGETRGAAGSDRNTADPAVSRTVRRTPSRPRGVPRSTCGTNPTCARNASYRQCASAHRGDRSRMAIDHQDLRQASPDVPSTPFGSDATSSSSGVGSSAMMAVIRPRAASPLERFLPTEHFVEHATEGEQIRASVGRPSSCSGAVVQRADDRAGRRQLESASATPATPAKRSPSQCRSRAASRQRTST